MRDRERLRHLLSRDTIRHWLRWLVDPGEPDAAGPLDVPRHSLWWVERLVRRRYVWLVGLGALLVAANEITLFGADPRDWDWLLVSGFVVLLGALYLSTLLPDRLEDALTRLGNRRVMTGGPALTELLPALHRDARRWALWGAAAAVAAIVLAFGWVGRTGLDPLLLVEALAAVPVGLFAGRAAYYGTLGRRLVRAGCTITPDPFHLDGAAGLLPAGELFAYQAKLLALPAGFLAVWWFLIPLFGDAYLEWRDPYVALLGLVVAAELLALVAPMVSFHRIMTRRKAWLFREADGLTARAAEVTPVRPEDPTARTSGVDDAAVKRYEAIEAMPTWPIDQRLRRRFGVQNLLLLVPVVAQAVGASQGSQEVLTDLGTWLSGS